MLVLPVEGYDFELFIRHRVTEEEFIVVGAVL